MLGCGGWAWHGIEKTESRIKVLQESRAYLQVMSQVVNSIINHRKTPLWKRSFQHPETVQFAHVAWFIGIWFDHVWSIIYVRCPATGGWDLSKASGYEHTDTEEVQLCWIHAGILHLSWSPEIKHKIEARHWVQAVLFWTCGTHHRVNIITDTTYIYVYVHSQLNSC